MDFISVGPNGRDTGAGVMHMGRMTILISSQDPALAEFLTENLDSALYRIQSVLPGPPIIPAASRLHPKIAVLDCVHKPPEVARMEIEVLRKAEPKVRIITLSESSPEDVTIVTSGVFYYMTQPPGPELIRVIDAAAQCFEPKPKQL